jgi:hypothetical protein
MVISHQDQCVLNVFILVLLALPLPGVILVDMMFKIDLTIHHVFAKICSQIMETNVFYVQLLVLHAQPFILMDVQDVFQDII